MKRLLTVVLASSTIFGLTACFDDTDVELSSSTHKIESNSEFEKYYSNTSSTCSSIDLTKAVIITNKETGKNVEVTKDMVEWVETPTCTAATNDEFQFKVDFQSENEEPLSFKDSVFVRPMLNTSEDLENLKFITGEEREEYIAAAENFLIESGSGGVPLYSNGSYRVYSDRFTAGNSEYQVGMGYAETRGTFSKDDAEYETSLGGSSIFATGREAHEGRTTLRTWTANSSSVSTLNPWMYTTSVESTVLSYMFDSLYKTDRGDDGNGIKYFPSMASEMPVALHAKEENNGELSSTEFIIPLESDLTFHDGSAITAQDYIDTHLLAFQENWTRTSNLTQTSFEIAGLTDFKALDKDEKTKAEWESSVGLKALDAIECQEYLSKQSKQGITNEASCLLYTMTEEKTAWDLTYNLASFIYTPIHSTWRTQPDDFGKLPEINKFNVVQNGPFSLSTLENNVEIHFDRADKVTSTYNAKLVNMYNYDAINYALLKDSLIAFDHYKEKNHLDFAAVPGTLYDDNKDNPTIKQVPGSVVWRLGINGFGSQENQIAAAESEALSGRSISKEYEPLAILENINVKNAMYLAIDRDSLATKELETSETSGYLFGRQYTADIQGGGSEYRQSDAGLSVGSKFGTNTSAAGYNGTAAKQYFELGIKEMIEAGQIEAGQKFEIDLRMFANSTTVDTISTHVKNQFEKYMISEEYDISVEVVVRNANSGESVYDDYRAATFDLGFMAINGSAFAPQSFLNTFSDTYESQFQYNYGTNTSDPEIMIHIDGEEKYISYNALYKLLNCNATVKDGRLVG